MKRHLQVTALRFALYARVSTEDQAEHGDSLEAQVQGMRQAVQLLKGEIAIVYQEQEHATEQFRDRASIYRLLADAKKGLFNAVMVRDSSRWSRDPSISDFALNELRKLSVAFYVGTHEQDLYSPEGRFMTSVAALVDRLHVEKMKYASACSRITRAQRGWPLGGEPPFARRLKNPSESRVQATAQWELDPDKHALARRLYQLYIEEGKSLGEVGQVTGMNPETIRRVLLDQSGSVWTRTLKDPDDGSMVKIATEVPPLLSEDERERVRARASFNKAQLAAWKRARTREYPLSGYVRCANPACGCSNLSGHPSPVGGKLYPRYAHVKKSGVPLAPGCVTAVRAGLLENAVLSEMGRLLSDEKELASAIQAAVISDPDERGRLQEEHAQLIARKKTLEKGLSRLHELFAEFDGTQSEENLKKLIRAKHEEIRTVEQKLMDLAERLKVVEVPRGFFEEVARLRRRFTVANGAAPILWPVSLQRTLVALFFGDGSTRFDRAGKHQRSADRGIFVAKAVDFEGRSYWTWEARGRIATITGALTPLVYLHDLHAETRVHAAVPKDELERLARTVKDCSKIGFADVPPAYSPGRSSSARSISTPRRSSLRTTTRPAWRSRAERTRRSRRRSSTRSRSST